VFNCSLRAPAVLTPAIVDELNRSFRLVRSLPCAVPLGDHPAQYSMQEKFGKLKNRGPNPFVDPAGCLLEADIQEAMFLSVLDEQRTVARPQQ
jgi:metallo-beta-lactamase class B